MYNEDDLLMLSALQHLLFCPRQCALIHIEQLWAENRFTAEGRILHERVHTAGRESRQKIRIEYDLPIRSLQLGLIGRADVVEFHRQSDDSWLPYPVEYKRGRPKKDDTDRVQLCAQAMCLEEMLHTRIISGALYYGKKKCRLIVDLSPELRQTTKKTAMALHELVAKGKTPLPQYSRRCDSCSFIRLCLPQQLGKSRKVASYIGKLTGVQP